MRVVQYLFDGLVVCAGVSMVIGVSLLMCAASTGNVLSGNVFCYASLVFLAMMHIVQLLDVPKFTPFYKVVWEKVLLCGSYFPSVVAKVLMSVVLFYGLYLLTEVFG